MKWRNYNYQKNLQKKLFAREDNSIWRRVQDLKRAGMSPVLAAGQGASAGPAISTKPPQSDLADKVMQAVMMKQNIAQSDAQIELLKQQKDTSSKQSLLYGAQKRKTTAEARYAEHEAGFFEGKPFIKGMSNVGKMASEVDSVMNWLKNRLGSDKQFDKSPKTTPGIVPKPDYGDYKQIR